jgi:RNA polymerase sigma factor for flagellar operon FliA
MNRNQLVIEHLSLASIITLGIGKRLPRHMTGFMDVEDLRQEARIGLLDAAAKYDRRRKVPFGAYAGRRIAGAVGDSLRRNDHLSRDCRAKVKAAEQEDPGAPIPLPEPDRLAGGFVQPDDQAAQAETRKLLATAVATLPSRLQILIHAYYCEGAMMSEIGKRLGVNESRISQLHTRAIRMLRHHFTIQNIGMEAFQTK